MNKFTIYILECQDEKYYVGKTTNTFHRIQDHFDSLGSAWTLLHKPVKVLERIEGCDGFDEDTFVLRYMEKYGIDNVRGGSFSSVQLDNDTRIHIQKMLQGATDKCYKCNSEEHFVSECPSNSENGLKCYICKRHGHHANSCYAKTDINNRYITKRQKECCYRCGRLGHWVLGCKYEQDIFGKECHYFTDDVVEMAKNICKLAKSLFQ